MHSTRFQSLDYLRGIACLIVVWAHLYVVGISDAITVKIWVPPLTEMMFGDGSAAANIHGQINLWMALSLGLSSGGLGVAIFFVISGFVILMSIDKLSPSTFITRRFLRIVPLNAIVVVMAACIMKLGAHLTGTDIGLDAKSLISSSLAINYWTSHFSILPILWTLEAEIFFYVFMAVASAAVGRMGFLHLLALAFVCLCSTFLLASKTSANGTHFAVLFTHVSFMLIGSVIYRAVETKRTLAGLFAAALAVAICWACFRGLKLEAGIRYVGYSFTYVVVALAIFMAALLTQMRWKIFIPLRFFGQISYPMYLVHVPVGWWAMWGLSKAGLGMYSATTGALVLVVLMSWALHELVETPIQDWAKGRNKSNRDLPPVAPLQALG